MELAAKCQKYQNGLENAQHRLFLSQVDAEVMREQLEHLYKAMDKLGNMRRLEDQVNYTNTKTELFTQDIIKQAEEVELTNKTQLKELD